MNCLNNLKYLIVAQPKTASTSLMHTLGRIGKLSYMQQMNFDRYPRHNKFVRFSITAVNSFLKYAAPDAKVVGNIDSEFTKLRYRFPCPDYIALSRGHSDIADFRGISESYQPCEFQCELQKQHFPPTEANLALFKNIPKIVLVRDPEETLDSYMRVPGDSTFKIMLENDQLFRLQLLQEIKNWRAGWLKEAEQHGHLVIQFSDLVKDNNYYINLAARHFGFISPEETIDASLSKERYYY